MWLDAIRKAEDDEESCLSCGSGVHRRVYREMYAGSFILDGERLDIRGIPAEGYADPVYLDPLTQFFDGSLYRLWPSERYFSKGGSRLHRDVWALAFGPVPKDCHVHHRDGDLRNNRIDNLECQPSSDHLGIKRSAGSPHKPGPGLSPYAREQAAAWPRSEEGRLWHRRHAAKEQFWTKRRRETRRCLDCGEEFSALVRKGINSQIYCTTACKQRSHNRKCATAKRNG